MKTNVKLMAALVALTMVAMAIPILMIDNTTDAAGEGNFQFMVYDSNEDWTVVSVSGYNAKIALDNSSLNVIYDTVTAGDTSIYCGNYTYNTGTYDTINPYYGKVKKINNTEITSTYTWNVFIYSPVTESWVAGPVDALGFYQAYSDYDSSLRTANIVLYYGTPTTTVPSNIPSVQLKDIITVEQNDDFKVTFDISVDPNVTAIPPNVDPAVWAYAKANPTKVVGYGSNAYLALVNAMSTTIGNNAMYDMVDDEINYGAYGYVSSILYLEEDSRFTDTSSEYWWWSIFTGISPDSTVWCDFLLGFYTPISGLDTPFVEDEFTIIYSYSIW